MPSQAPHDPSAASRAEPLSEPVAVTTSKPLLLLFAVLAVVIMAIGWGVYGYLARQVEAQKNAELLTIARLKSQQIASWLDEHDIEAKLMVSSPFLEETVAQWLKARDPATASQIRQRLTDFLAAYPSSQSIVLLDAQDSVLLQVGEPHLLTPELRKAAAQARLQHRGGRTDLYRADLLLPEHRHLDFAPPLGNAGLILVLRADPHKFLFPFIQSWPVPSLSAETLLVRRDDDQVLYLNDLRFATNTANKLRLSLSRAATLPAALAVLTGGSGNFRGQDYRLIPVLSAYHAVPGTTWMLIAKVDQAELSAPLRIYAWLLATGVLAALTATGSVVLYLARRRETAQRLALLTLRQQQLDAIQTSERKFRTLIDNLPDIAWHKDAEGLYVSCNRRYAEALHLAVEAIIGHRDEDFFPPELAAKYQADDRLVIESGQELSTEEHLLQNGKSIWLHTRKARILDNNGRCLGTIGVGRDITERKHQEERTAALLELSTSTETDEKTLLQQGLDKMQYLTDSRIGFLHFVSEDQKEIELVTWSSDTLTHYCQAAFDRHYPLASAGIWVDTVLLKQPIIINDYATAPGKKGLPAGHSPLQRFISVPVFEGPLVRMIVGVGNAARDYDGHDVETLKLFSYDLYRIVQHQRAEEKIRQFTIDLEQRILQRTGELEAANADLEGFSYSVSHDLRAPLRAIDGFSAILREDYAQALDTEGQRLLQVVSDNARKMGQLIDDILAFARASRHELQMIRLDMAALVGEVWQGLEPQRQGRDFDLRLTDLPTASGDPAAIRQVWQNLLGNAIKFTRGRTPAVIEVGGRTEGAENLYYLKDNGIGFDPAYTAKLFGLFQRLHGMDEFEGTGVGLAIVKRFVLKHGGRVWAEGRVGDGATFWFSLPREDGE